MKNRSTTWSAQDAKNNFGEMLEASALTPQTVTKHGHETAVMVSAEEYKRLKRVEESKKPSFVDLLLAIPQGDEEIFESLPIKFRDIDL